MILVDADIWIDHFRSSQTALIEQLDANAVLMHPYTIGEVALGSLHQRDRVLDRMRKLLRAPVVSHRRVMELVEVEGLYSKAVGYVDVHLLASSLSLPGLRLWTRDRKLRAQAERLDVLAELD